MNLLHAGLLKPLHSFDTKNGISRVSDDFSLQMDYIESIQELGDVHDDMEVLSVGTEAYLALKKAPSNTFRVIALETICNSIGTEGNIEMAIKDKMEELKNSIPAVTGCRCGACGAYDLLNEADIPNASIESLLPIMRTSKTLLAVYKR